MIPIPDSMMRVNFLHGTIGVPEDPCRQPAFAPGSSGLPESPMQNSAHALDSGGGDYGCSSVPEANDFGTLI
jgi:hypothetical protein